MTQANTPNPEAIAYAKAAFAAHPDNVGKALRNLLASLDAREVSRHALSYNNLLFKEQAVKAFEGMIEHYEKLTAERSIMEAAVDRGGNEGIFAKQRIADIAVEIGELTRLDEEAIARNFSLEPERDLDGEESDEEEEIEQEDEFEGEYEEEEWQEIPFGEEEPEAPMTELLTLTKVGELRQSLVAGIVCLTDTDNEGEVRHQFLTANQGFIRHHVGHSVLLREPINTEFHAFDLVNRMPAVVRPDMFTGTAHLVANFVTPEGLAAQRDGQLVLDAKVGPLFLSALPSELPPYAVAFPAVGGLNEAGRLIGVYPYRPVTREVTHEAPSNSL